jgi:hypothetical protein
LKGLLKSGNGCAPSCGIKLKLPDNIINTAINTRRIYGCFTINVAYLAYLRRNIYMYVSVFG